MAEKLEKDEEARIAAQVEKLGPEGLKHAEEELSKATAENERPIPTEILTNFPVPDVKSISWISCQSVQERGTGREPPAASNGQSKLAEHLAVDGEELPFFVQYDHVQVRVRTVACAKPSSSLGFQSDFVTIHGLFALDKLPNHLRP
jgi:Zn-dependent M16 (insulinase) family peptidase